MQRLILLALGALALASAATSTSRVSAQTKAPQVPAELAPQIEPLQAGVRLTLLAEHPSLVTPTGIDVDAQGRIWLIACHTHFRPEGYPGPEHDEVLVFDKDGKNRRVFYNQTEATMHVKLGEDGWVYLAERDRILRVKDTDGDGVGDTEENVAVLDSVSDYPHNGLSGMAWHPDGGLIFSLGENFGKDWTLTARDGTHVSGRGEGGVFSCKPDGTQLRRIARGFWNPFGLLVRSDGEIFAAENDPGARPPCRLLQIIEGADYGFQWVYGSAPVHPFVAWNGELRGTLGMIHPCGEGPSAIVQLGGGVLIPSWSNHAIDYFPLIRQGAGYTSKRVEVLRGSEYFRPVGMAAGPDGSFYVTDWVFSSYELHQRGRLWKLEIDQDKSASAWVKPQPDPLNADARLAQQLRDGTTKLSLAELFDYARGADPYLSDAALAALARIGRSWSPATLSEMEPEDRLWALVALRRIDLNDEKWVRAVWEDKDPRIRFEALRWIADGVLTSFTSDVEHLLKQPDIDYEIFEAALATWNTLRGNPGAGVTDPGVLVERVTDPATPAKIKSYALRLAPATDKKIDVPLLRHLFSIGDRDLSVEVVRTLAAKKQPDAWEMLAEIAGDQSRDSELRADATAGIAQSAQPAHVALLLALASDQDVAVRKEALRGLRSSSLDASASDKLDEIAKRFPESAGLVAAALDPTSLQRGRPELNDTAGWLQRLEKLSGKPDAAAGRRIFQHANVGMCAKCHRHTGRGNVVGPDLSLVARQGDRASILRSILEPNRDVAPQYFATALELEDGNVFSGILLRSSSTEVFRDATGKERVFQKSDIVQRKELKTSLMPTGLIAQMTDEELRDLLEFLTESGK